MPPSDLHHSPTANTPKQKTTGTISIDVSDQIIERMAKRIATLEFQLDKTKKQLRARNNDIELYKGTIKKLTESVGKFMATDIERYQMKEKALAELEYLKSTHQHYSKSIFSGRYELNQQLTQEAILNREKI